MKKFKKVTIIGIGLIGGSIALSLKKKGLAGKIVGVAKHKETIEKAKRCGAIDEGSLSLIKSIKGSDLVILATPICSSIKIAKSIVKHMDKGAILTDVGSTKKLVTKEIERIIPNGVYFVGGHPLTGSEQRGILAANQHLFKDSIWILTQTKNTSLQTLARIKGLVMALGANILVMSPSKHDKILSEISHLPHILASCLVNSTADRFLPLAAGSFKDTTRVASSDPILWRDICLTNKEEVIKAIDKLNFNLSTLRRLIKSSNSDKILKTFIKAKNKRDDYCN